MSAETEVVVNYTSIKKKNNQEVGVAIGAGEQKWMLTLLREFRKVHTSKSLTNPQVPLRKEMVTSSEYIQ